MAVTNNVLQRTLYIRSDTRRGACFAIEHNGRQYLATAKHIFEGSRTDQVSVLHNNSWHTVHCVTHFARHGIDVALLDLGFDLAPRHPVRFGLAHTYLGEDTFLAGYPLDFYNDCHMINNGKPIPLVSKGCISGYQFDPDAKEGKGVYIATSTYEGYSGGPAICQAGSGEPIVLGIISHNITMKSEQEHRAGQKIIVIYPSGIVFASDMNYAIQLAAALTGDPG